MACQLGAKAAIPRSSANQKKVKVVAKMKEQKFRYQLVLQWPVPPFDYDTLIEIENSLINQVTASEVDGHDAGSGEVNIFILTNDPKQAFSEIRSVLAGARFWSDIRVAHRNLKTTKYTILWPTWLTDFRVV